MPISQQIGSSSLAKPGVCTSTTRPASPYQGQVIYQTDTNTTLVWNGSGWVFLATSSAGDVGSVKVIPTSATGGTIDNTGTVTVGTAQSFIEIGGAFSTSFDAYKIYLSGGSATASTVLMLTLGSGGIGAVGYYFVFSYAYFTSNPALSDVGNNTDKFLYAGQAGANGCAAEITLINPNLASQTFCTSYIYAGNGTYAGTMNGVLGNNTQYTTFRLTPNSGTISGAKIRIYGQRN